jgi:hypothetical protein
MIGWSPLLPAAVVLPAVLFAVAAAVWAYRRGGGPALPRALGLLLLALLLAGPELVRPTVVTDPPVLALVLDASASMARSDAGEDRTRAAAAEAALAAVAAGAGPAWRVERWAVDTAVVPGWRSPGSGGTDLDALGELLAGRPAAVVLASDGADRGSGAVAERFAAAGVPVSCLGVGSTDPAANAAVRLDAPSPSAFIGQDLAITATISASPALHGRQARLHLGDEERTVTLAAELRVTVTRPAGARAGTFAITARLDALPEEITAADNRAELVIPVVDRRLNLVVIEGQPWFDTAAAVRAWRRDRQLAVSTYQRLGERTLAAGPVAGETAPPVATSLATADLVVLGVASERVLDAAGRTALTAALERGAGLLLLGGWRPADDPGAAFDPLLWRDAPRSREATASAGPAAGRFALGEAAALAKMPGLEVADHGGLRPLAEVVLGSNEHPLLVAGRHGAARTASVAASGWWRWHQADPVLAERLWRQLAKALAPGGGGALNADRDRYRRGAVARLAVAEGVAMVRVTAPDGTAGDLVVRGGAATVTLDQTGRWAIAADSATLTIVVEEDVREVVDDARDDARLARLATTTGGSVADPAQAAALGAALARRADLGAAAPERFALATAWWWWMPLLAALLGWEWWQRRRRHGVV